MLERLFSKLKKRFEPHTARLRPSGVSFEVSSNQTLLQAALAADIAFPYHCTVGTCGNCKCKLIEGNVCSLTDTSLTLTETESSEGYILACQCMLKTDVLIGVDIASNDAEQTITSVMGRITDTRKLTQDIIAVRVELDEPLSFLAGQFADIGLPGFGRHRSYSFANTPRMGGSKTHDFVVRRVSGGEYTQWLFAEDRLGERFELRGPQGAFWLRPASAPLLFLAGGSGMAPILSILGDMQQKCTARPVIFLFGAREQSDLYYLDEINDFTKNWPDKFEFIPVLSDEAADSDWAGARGLVTDFIDELSVGFAIASCNAYLCGPPGMIDAALLKLEQQGLNTEDTYYDKFLDSRQIN